MGAGFIRRYAAFPPVSTIRQIEGVIIVDGAPPGQIDGTETGTSCLVGEFADCTYAVDVSTSGVVTPKCKPVEVFSAQDLAVKVGGFDRTIGAFGVSCGNGFAELRSKQFTRLILAPIDIVCPASGSTGACRFWRQLPTNRSATDPTPITPVAPGLLAAGREFVSGTSRILVASRIVFTDEPAYAQDTDGSVTNAGAPATTQTFTRVGGSFLTDGVQVGDILVLGVIGGAAGLGANAGCYRVTVVTDALNLVVQKMDGSAFDWTTDAATVWRLHVASTADSAGLLGAHVALATPGGYGVPCRPITATVAIATALTPLVVPDSPSATVWDTLSGLTGITHPSAALTYDPNIHGTGGVGPAANASVDARYQTALDSLLDDDYPMRDVRLLWCARKSTTIAAATKAHVLNARSRGLTRTAPLSPALSTITLAGSISDTAPGVGANRNEALDYAWPGARISMPEGVGIPLTGADGRLYSDGIIDTTADGWLVSVCSLLAPERNPGQAVSPVPQCLAPILALQRSAPVLAQPEYTMLRQKGIVALRNDRVSGWLFQSGVTTSLTSGEKNIARRRMADFIQDSIADRMNQLSKLPLSQSLKDSVDAEIDAFLSELKSDNNPAASRITDYQIDSKNGNTPDTEAAGIYVVIIRVRLTPTADFIVLQTEIGEGVRITEVAQAA